MEIMLVKHLVRYLLHSKHPINTSSYNDYLLLIHFYPLPTPLNLVTHPFPSPPPTNICARESSLGLIYAFIL